MPLAARHHDDPAPPLVPAPALTIAREEDAAFMAALQRRDEAEIAARFAAGHRAYVARWEGEAAAWGWVATRSAVIGELGATFALPPRERYLWNFVTLPSHRGRGIYPRLLDAIVRAESREADRFWIVYAPENHASGAGVRRAGFADLADLSFDASGRPALRELFRGGAATAARLFGLPEVGESLAPCWRCVRVGRPGMSCRPGECRCDYQRPESGCAA
jgi:ribosomal protein S18 acetylase RimI-like enzyme